MIKENNFNACLFLDEDEEVIWKGKAGKKYFEDFGILTFSAAFTLLALIFINLMPVRWYFNPTLLMLLFGLILLGITYWAYYISDKILYIITNKRAVIYYKKIIDEVHSDQIDEVFYVERKDYYFDVFFKRESGYDEEGDFYRRRIGFLCLEEPEYAEKLLIDLSCGNL